MYKSILGDFVVLPCNVFLIFLGMSRTKAYVFRQIWDECFPEMLSKLMVSSETSLKKSKKMSRNIQILVWPTRDETWLRKVVPRLRETTIFKKKSKSGSRSCPASQDPPRDQDSLYKNYRSTAPSGRYVNVYLSWKIGQPTMENRAAK